jgi:Second Messenger Oligonucleotide or Dinucleotide Synthetase domain
LTKDMLPDYVTTLVPPPYDRRTVAERKDQIVAALESAGIDVVSKFETGSFSHGTGIKNKADVDLMVWASLTQKPSLPSSALDRFRKALRDYLSALSVSTSSPTVKIKFWSAPHFEVAPAFYGSEINGTTVYDIGGRRDEWIKSAPSAHNALVNQQNDRLYRKVKPLIRLVKAWKYHVGAPVSSFYLEMRVTEYVKTEIAIVYYIDLRRALRAIVNNDVADMNDPGGIAGRIPACSSDDKRSNTKSLMQSAISDLDAAEAHRLANDGYSYWNRMKAVFGDEFPYPTS